MDIYVFTHMCIYRVQYAHVCTHIYLYTIYNHIHHICMYMYIHEYTCIYMYMPYVYTCTCVYITYVYTCMWMYMPYTTMMPHHWTIEFRTCKDFRDYPAIRTPQFFLPRVPTIINSMVVILSGQEPLAPSSVTPKIYFKRYYLLWTPKTSYMLQSDGRLPESQTQGCLKNWFN